MPQKTKRPFVHLHVHTDFSVLDGLSTVDEYVERAKKLGQPAMAITDHGVMCGAPAFYHACRKAEIEPILGSEMYFVPDASNREKGEERYHVVVLARGETGYRVLTELSTEAHRHYYYKPTLDKATFEALGDDAKHLVVLSGCAASVISKAVTEDREREAAEWVMWWRETCPNFFMELQHHDTTFDKKLNEGLLELARRYNVPWVVTNDPHYAIKEDCDHHDALLAIQTAADINDPNRFRFDGNGYHLRSRAEMRRVFEDTYGREVWKPGAASTLRIARACKTRIQGWEKRSWHIPKYPDVEDAFIHLLELTMKGMTAKGLDGKPEYVERVKHELEVIKRANISDFLLITLDSIEWAKQQGIPVGPGRGSVAGTLVGYCIGLHKIDPVRYHLMFERFLNPERPRMPDIDTDFGQKRREELFEYVAEKYGKENVVHVCTYGRMKIKAAFRSLAKAYGISYGEALTISKDLSDEDEDVEALPAELKKAHPDLVAQIKRLSGVKRSISTHPAGVLIADPTTNIRTIVPEMWIPNTKRWVGQYDLEAIEEMGLMKQDFLGLRTLDTIAEAVRLIKEDTGEEVDPDSWVPDEEPDDAAVYEMLKAGRTAGVFQMEGPTNQRGIRDISPTGFEDVVSCTALYRTGPISAGFPNMFLKNRKAGKEEIWYATPKLKPILEETWGVILYQEQVMEIGRELAGFNMAEVDDLKEAIKHKKSALMVEMRPRFVQGCKEHSDISKSISTAIWKQIEGYSGYAYNRAHAVAYTFLTYQTARLKKMYPKEFITALLRTVEDKDKREVYLREAVEMGIKILPPDINESDLMATPTEDGIRFGIADIAGIGIKAGEKLIKWREYGPYTDALDVDMICNNTGIFAKLEAVGALESLGMPGRVQEAEALLNWSFRDTMKPWREKYKSKVKFPKFEGGYVCLVGEIVKRSKGKGKTDKPYMTWKLRWSVTESFDIRLWSETSRHWKYPEGSIVMVSGKWEEKWLNISVGNPEQVKLLHRADT